MKKLILILAIIFAFGVVAGGIAEAKTDRYFVVWSVIVTTGDDNDAPDYIYKSQDGNAFVSVGATSMINTAGAKGILVQWDSLYGDASNTVGGLSDDITNADVMPSATATNWDINVLSCSLGICDTGLGASAFYHQEDDLTTDLKGSFELTPSSGEGIKLTVDGDVLNAAPVIRVTVIW